MNTYGKWAQIDNTYDGLKYTTNGEKIYCTTGTGVCVKLPSMSKLLYVRVRYCNGNGTPSSYATIWYGFTHTWSLTESGMSESFTATLNNAYPRYGDIQLRYNCSSGKYGSDYGERYTNTITDKSFQNKFNGLYFYGFGGYSNGITVDYIQIKYIA